MKNFMWVTLCGFVLSAINCSNTNDCKSNSLIEMEKLYSIPLNNNGTISYQHIVFIKKLNQKYVDSSFIFQAVHQYMDSLRSDSPVSSIEFFNSKKGFDLGETLSQPKEVYENCLVTIWFDISSGKPYKYIFYGKNGEVTHQGALWKNGKNN